MSANKFITTVEHITLVEEYLKKEFIDSVRINTTDYINVFLKTDLIYGKGVRNINRGFITPKDFGDSSERVPNASVPELFTETLSEQLKLIYSNTVSQEYYLSAMNNAEELANFIKQLTGRLKQSYEMNLYQSVGYLFNDRVNDNLLMLSPKQKETLNTIKTFIDSTSENIQVEAQAEDVERIIRLKSFELTRFKKENSGNKEYPAACPVKEQVLIISNELYQSILLTRKTQFNPTDLFKEFHKVIILDSDVNTFYILDKEALRIYPRFNKVLTQDYNSKLETDYYLHFWLTFGIYKGFVVKKYVLTQKA